MNFLENCVKIRSKEISQMKHSAKKRRKHAKRRLSYRTSSQMTANPKSPLYRRLYIRMMDSFRNSHFLRGASTLTLFPQHPEVDFSMYGRNAGNSPKIGAKYTAVCGDAYHQESARIREYERKK